MEESISLLRQKFTKKKQNLPKIKWNKLKIRIIVSDNDVRCVITSGI